jgi:hypothetical protein
MRPEVLAAVSEARAGEALQRTAIERFHFV